MVVHTILCSFNTASVLIQRSFICAFKRIIDRFNTASVLIQPNFAPFLRHPMLFQYSFCSYSTIAQLPEKWQVDLFQYSFCSYSTYMYAMKDSTDRSFNTASVLIQRKISELSSRTDLFQYSFCSYSTVHCVSAFYFCSFQYSFCSYSTSPSYERSVHFFLFQYSFCSYSTGKILYLIIVRNSFNTASVLIQQVKNLDWFYKRKFQYSFCSYSTFIIWIKYIF